MVVSLSMRLLVSVARLLAKVFSEPVALVVSVARFALIESLALERFVVSVARLVAKTFSAEVALVVSVARFALIESSALVRFVISVASPAEFPEAAAST